MVSLLVSQTSDSTSFLFSILMIAILLIGKKFFYSAKINLFKDQAAWSGNDIKIKYRNSEEVSGSERNENYLKKIADESRIYLEDQYTKNEE